MEKLLNPSFAFLWILALVWIFRSRRALTTLRLVPRLRSPHRCQAPVPGTYETPLVSIVLPAKNEEANIRACLESLLAQDYPQLEIIVANDGSTDQTESLLQSFGTKIRTLNVPKTPAGWTGKNFALATAVPKTRGPWLLFTDADTRHHSASVSASVTHALTQNLDFLTLLPHCLTENFFEPMIQPLAMTLLGLWFPLEKVNDPRSPHHFANGQYLLIKRELYEKIGGHETVRGEFLEDFALMKESKARKARAQCAFGVELYGTRMYQSLEGIWNGWRRIYLHAFRRSAPRLLLKALSLVFFSVVPFATFIPLSFLALTQPDRYAALWGALIPVLLFIWVVCWQAYGMVKAKRIYALLHPFAAFFLGAVLLDAAWMAASKKATEWR